MKTKATLALLALATTAFAQGPLTPPGAPAPTMKTLDEIHAKVVDVGERRTEVNATNTPGDASYVFRITTPGSYYLSGPVSTAGDSGIEITASNVTLDLNGFAITRTTLGGPGYAINIGETAEAVTVKGGVVGKFRSGVYSMGAGTRVEKVRVAGMADAGIFLYGAASSAESCDVFGGVGASMGIFMGHGVPSSLIGMGVVRNCSVSRCYNPSGTSLYGIYLQDSGVVEGCTVSDLLASGFCVGISASASIVRSSRVSHVESTGSGGYGIAAYGSSVLDSSASRASGAVGSTGILLSFGSASRCESTYNGDFGFIGSGFHSEGRSNFTDCSTSGNIGAGFIVENSGSVLTNCHATGYVNAVGQAAFFVSGNNNRLEGCSGRDAAFGFRATGVRNVFIRNTAGANTTNYSFVAGNDYGTIVDLGSFATPAVNGSSAAGSITTTDPRANFVH